MLFIGSIDNIDIVDVTMLNQPDILTSDLSVNSDHDVWVYIDSELYN